MITNILKVYQSALPHEYGSVSWYRDARTSIIQAAADCEIDPLVLTAMVAVLSPRMPWAKNIAAAVSVAKDEPLPGIMAVSLEKAYQIRYGNLTALSGQKVENFFRNLWDPSDPEPVTVDVWADRVAAFDSRKANKGIGPKRYQEVAQAYRDAADRIGILPNQLQAITWTVARRFGRARVQFTQGTLL